VRIRLRPWQFCVLMAVLCVGSIGVLVYIRSFRGATVRELAAHLPTQDAILLHVDVQALRGSGLLDLLAGSKAAEESDYKLFVEQSDFDYRQDLDTVLASFYKGGVYFLLRGRFDWKNLMEYATLQGGVCHNAFCRVETSRPERYISFFGLKHNVMALAVSSDSWAATTLFSKKRDAEIPDLPGHPVWVRIPASALQNKDWLPAGTRAFASALAGAETVSLALGASGPRFEAVLNVTCRSPEEAARLSAQLENLTNMLRNFIARENKTPNPRDLSSVLTAGSFRHVDRQVVGRWPIERVFLESVAGGA
jgi:hypothetical protein